ncbi:LysR family transcriptional regulator [Rhodococcus koreensis]|uniref:LysR family transcriptional regulator n=1 Tax=Rhodococcus koreensis TaxID=99653 RepID=UPI0036DF2F25
MIDADDLRYFLEVARTGRLVAAGKGLGVNHTTVGRRITALERALGNRLFDRVPTGWVLTDAGHELVVHAESIESALLAAMEGAASGGGRLSGTVRIATPDGFGAFVLAPNLETLYSQHPDLDIEIVTATRHDVLAAREFDVAVTLERPSPRAVDIGELADYRLGLYASANYLDTHPRISHVLDLHEHALIGYVDSLLDVPALRILDEVLPGHRTRIQTNNITGQWTATAAGLGVSALPLYIGDPDPRLVRILEEEVTVLRKYWLIVPRELQRLARVRAAIAALRSLAAVHEGLVTRTG